MAIDLEAIFIEVTRAIIVARFYRLLAFYGFYIVLYRCFFFLMLELWERIEEEWKAIPDSVCRDLVESMPGRIAAVIKAKGDYTKY